MNDLPELTPVEFEPMKINFGFPHFAVCISPNFRRIKVIHAHIHPSETVHRVGIVPGTDIFDSYKDEMVSVTLNMDGLSEPDIKEQCIYMFGALVVIADKPNIYQSCCREVEEGKLIESHNGFIGFFKSSKAAITAIEKEREKYIAALQSDMNAVISISNIRNLFAKEN